LGVTGPPAPGPGCRLIPKDRPWRRQRPELDSFGCSFRD